MPWTRCRKRFTQFAAAPILSAGRVAGAVVLGSSLADVIVSFNRLSAADLGVLVPTGTLLGLPADKNFLPRLGLQVIGLSSAERNLPLLQQVEEIPPMPGGSAWRLLSYDGGQFELSFLALDTPLDASSPAIMVVIDDLTQALDDIRKSVWNRLRGELLASLLSLLLLALLVHAPLQRMTRAVRAIPLLGRRAFVEARARIAPRARRLVDDEIDSLDEAAIALSHRLETLENEVAAHSAETQAMLRRISVERDFSRSLLDTAQVIILTQSADGRILTLNRYGRLLSGWGQDDLLGKRFFDFVGSDGSSGLAVHSPISDTGARERGALAAEEGIALIDAPVSGGAIGAAEGTLAIMAGGDRSAIDACRPVFAHFASLVKRFGDTGAGTQAKIVRNLITFASFCAVGEAQRIAEAAGLNLGALGDVVRHSDRVTGGAGAIMLRQTAEAMAADDPLRPIFAHTAALGTKDLELAATMARSLGVDSPFAALSMDRLARALGLEDG